MPRVHGHKRLDDNASRVSLSLAPGKRQCLVLNEPGRRPVETQKNFLGRPVHVCQWSLSKKVVVTVYTFFTVTPNLSNLIAINPVLHVCNNLEHLTFTK